MKTYGGDSPIFILVNLREDGRTPDIDKNNLKDEYPMIMGYYYFSLRDDYDELEKFRQIVVESINKNISWNDKLPISYFAVKKELENRFANGGIEKIPLKDFYNIAKENGISEENRANLLKNLHSLGVCLWYESMKGVETLVLNPEWISSGVYQIVNGVHENKGYSVSLTDLKNIFSDSHSHYSIEDHNFLFKLMETYELAYRIKDEKEDSLIIPHLLKRDRPDKLPEFPKNESLEFRYTSEQTFLSSNIISRFIVRHNKEMYDRTLVWRDGVVLKNPNGSTALISKKYRSNIIEIKIRGTETDRKDYLIKIRKTLDILFNSYRNEPELEYPLWVSNQNSYWMSQDHIIDHYLREQPIFIPPTGESILAEKIMEIFAITLKGILESEFEKLTKNILELVLLSDKNISELKELVSNPNNRLPEKKGYVIETLKKILIYLPQGTSSHAVYDLIAKFWEVVTKLL